jgi:serine/threonine protein kinase
MWLKMVDAHMEGGSLETASLDPTEQNCAVISLTKALAFLHIGKGIVHQDLKPSNVLLTAARECKIGDFGSARAVELGLTQTKLPVTMQYAPPEVQEGDTADFASDMWSFGLIMFKIVSGKPLFPDDTPMAKLVRLAAGTQRPTVPKSASPGLCEVISRCWEADPTKRPTVWDVCEIFARENWNVIAGADRARVKKWMERFPADESASKGELLALLRAKEAEVNVLTAKVTSQSAEQAKLEAALDAEKADKARRQAIFDAEKAKLQTEIADLRGKSVPRRPPSTSRPASSRLGRDEAN